MTLDPCPSSELDLEERLSRPTPGVIATLGRHPGDLLVLGAGGKMGPSLCRMAARALERLGSASRVIAVSRFTAPGVRERLEQWGVRTIATDLLDPRALAGLPQAAALIYMAGQKFGTRGEPSLTWAMNAAVPAYVSARFAGIATVVFSTGNVYPLTPTGSGGPTEDCPPAPVGEYAMSCLARERIFEHAARTRGTPVLLLRLNYAVDLRYGVLADLARRIAAGQPVPLAMGYANVIWQGDANARAIQSLDHCAAPAATLNLTGPVFSIRTAAERLGRLLGRMPHFSGTEADDALLSNPARSLELFGPLEIDLDALLGWTAAWVRRGGRSLDKPTHFEARDGQF